MKFLQTITYYLESKDFKNGFSAVLYIWSMVFLTLVTITFYSFLSIFFTKFQHTKIRFLFLRFYLFFYLLLWKKASSSVIKGFPKGVRAQKFRLCWEAPTVQAVAAQVSGPWFWRCCSAMCVEWSTMSKQLKFISKSRQEYYVRTSFNDVTAARFMLFFLFRRKGYCGERFWDT